MIIEGRRVVIVSRTIAAVPAACAAVRATSAGFAGFELHAPFLLVIPAGVAGALVAGELLLEAATRRVGYETNRAGVPLLLAACACALALGNAPGLVLASLTLTAVAVGVVATMAALLSGSARTACPRALTVLYFAALGAAWQVGVAPLLAILLVHE